MLRVLLREAIAMLFQHIIDDMEAFLERLFAGYFNGEWTIPWLPDDL